MKKLIITLSIVLISSITFADTITLKNGKRIKVDNLRLEGETVIGVISGGEIQFKINQIADIEESQRRVSKSNQTQKQIIETPESLSEARKLAIKAYEHAANNPFNATARYEALEILNRARALDPNEAEVYLTEAVMILQDGYRHGPWYKSWAYNEGVVDSAISKINNAISADPDYYRSYTMLSWMLITKSEYSRAEELLEKSNKLQDSFYYWLYKGTLSQEKKEYNDAQTYYDIAEGYADSEGLRSMLMDRRKEIAKESGDFEKAEQYYLDEIARDPESAYSYGNYAGFLLCTGRFEESIGYYEKAISIKPYPKVLLGLEVAKMGIKGAAKCKNDQVQI
jgi:tetratricopeptide (TPR) repeat protein